MQTTYINQPSLELDLVTPSLEWGNVLPQLFLGGKSVLLVDCQSYFYRVSKIVLKNYLIFTTTLII